MDTWRRLLLFLTFGFLVSCATKEQISVAQVANEVSLKHMPFPFGAAVSVPLLSSNAQYKALVVKEFSSITAENAMKFESVHPAQNKYNFVEGDEIIALARASGMRVHGHTLIWHRSQPAWVTQFKGDTKAWESLFKTHIQTVAAHYKGKVSSWDVVNEALEEDGSYRNSIWLQKLGVDYIARAFKYAHQADPKAVLFYNDYGHDYNPKKRTAILNLVMQLKDRGIPIHGIGLQMHTRYTQSDEDLTLAIRTAAATGLKVHISELDITLNPNSDLQLTYTEHIADLQAEKYKFIVKTYYNIPKEQQFGITTWNVTDGDTWITSEYKRPDWPLPFDRNFSPKAAYHAILDAVN